MQSSLVSPQYMVTYSFAVIVGVFRQHSKPSMASPHPFVPIFAWKAAIRNNYSYWVIFFSWLVEKQHCQLKYCVFTSYNTHTDTPPFHVRSAVPTPVYIIIIQWSCIYITCSCSHIMHTDTGKLDYKLCCLQLISHVLCEVHAVCGPHVALLQMENHCYTH